MQKFSINILCSDFDCAKKFYVDYVGFEVNIDEVMSYGAERMRRLVLDHKIVKDLEIEFSFPSNEEEKLRIGKQGGTLKLFSIQSDNVDEIIDIIKNSNFFVNATETPYAKFLNILDPMGNIICMYQSA